jgi:uncharacterized phage protein (TIGR02218 family)
MSQAARDLERHMSLGASTVCFCWKISLANGTVLGFTDHDENLVFGAVTYSPSDLIDPTALRYENNLGEDFQDIDGVITDDRITEDDIINGFWNGATVEVYLVNWKNTNERKLVRFGEIGKVTRKVGKFVAEVSGMTSMLSQERGRFYQSMCDARLGDTRCGVDLSLPVYNGSGAIVEVLSDTDVRVSGLLSFDDKFFSRGYATFNTGILQTKKVHVAVHRRIGSNAFLTFNEATTKDMQAGDVFNIVAGCNKSLSACTNKFNNVTNFRGFPHIPSSDSVLRVAIPKVKE